VRERVALGGLGIFLSTKNACLLNFILLAQHINVSILLSSHFPLFKKDLLILYLWARYTHSSRDGPCPDPIRAYFWPAVNKMLTRLWPRYFSTRPEEIFLIRREKIKKFDIFRGNFPNSNTNHKWLTRLDPGQKCLTWTHHYTPPIRWC